MKEEKYPGILDRVKAVFTDSVVLIVFMFIISYVFSLFDNVHDGARMIAFVFIFGLYDPLFTSLFGGTIGHMVRGIRVKKENDHNKNINFLFAIVRFLTKVTLGSISLLTISGSEKRQAIHDYFVGSVVIFEE